MMDPNPAAKKKVCASMPLTHVWRADMQASLTLAPPPRASRVAMGVLATGLEMMRRICEVSAGEGRGASVFVVETGDAGIHHEPLTQTAQVAELP